jgi:hypothetical protein
MRSMAHEKLENDYILINLQKNYDSFLNNSRSRNKNQCPMSVNMFGKNGNQNISKCPLNIAKKYDHFENDKKISLKN